MRISMILILFLGSTVFCLGQSQRFFTGLFPEVSLTRKLSNDNKINVKVENQHVFYDNRMGESEDLQYRHYRTDLMAFYDWRLGPTRSVALGVFHRIQDGSNGNRIIQQFAMIQRLRDLRLNHRFRTDQTFTRGEKIEVRFRYRFALEIPLNGATLDPGENYLVLSNEPIISHKDRDFEIENRLVFGFGKLYKNGQRLEWSTDYRTDGFISGDFRTRLWLKIGYFSSF